MPSAFFRLVTAALQSLLVFTVSLIVFFMPGRSPALAASSIPTSSPLLLMTASPLPSSSQLRLDVQGYLNHIPSDFYAIRTVAQLKQQLAATNPLLIDVREFNEFNAGHIPSAINLPLRTLTEHLAEIPQDRPVIVYCSTGYRAAMAVMTLNLLGYQTVSGFPPSYQGWQAAGESVARVSTESS